MRRLLHVFLWLHCLVLCRLRVEVERLRKLLVGSVWVQRRLHGLLTEVLGLLRRLVVEVRIVLVGIGSRRLPLAELRRIDALILASLETLIFLELIAKGLLGQHGVRHLLSVGHLIFTLLEVLWHIVFRLEHDCVFIVFES